MARGEPPAISEEEGSPSFSPRFHPGGDARLLTCSGSSTPVLVRAGTLAPLLDCAFVYG